MCFKISTVEFISKAHGSPSQMHCQAGFSTALIIQDAGESQEDTVGWRPTHIPHPLWCLRDQGRGGWESWPLLAADAEVDT